jgi:hypothetical protein
MIDRGSASAELRPSSSREDEAALELAVGNEVIEVRVDRSGIRFRHPRAGSVEGHLPWDVALALSLLPETLRRASRTASVCRPS